MSEEFVSFHDIDNSSFRMDLSKVTFTCTSHNGDCPTIRFLYGDFDILTREEPDREFTELQYDSTPLRDEDLHVFNFVIGTLGAKT